MVEAPVNRIKEHLREASPATRQERGDNYIDTLQLALDTLRGLMTSFNPDMQYKAVSMMLDFEKTRLRHNHPLAGMELVPPVDLDEPVGTMPKYDKPELQVIDEIVDEDEVIDLDELTAKEQTAFKAMVEEAVVYFAVEGEQRDAVRKRIELQLWTDLSEYGFETVARSFRHCMDKRKAKVVPVVRPANPSATLDWPG